MSRRCRGPVLARISSTGSIASSYVGSATISAHSSPKCVMLTINPLVPIGSFLAAPSASLDWGTKCRTQRTQPSKSDGLGGSAAPATQTSNTSSATSYHAAATVINPCNESPICSRSLVDSGALSLAGRDIEHKGPRRTVAGLIATTSPRREEERYRYPETPI
jgi:hypothetical protein